MDKQHSASWDQILNIQAQVTEINSLSIVCVCLIDKESKVFEYRTFPVNMFSHLDGIRPKSPVIISIKTKAGSSRIDIYDGKGRVDNTLFTLKDDWESIDYTDFSKPLSVHTEMPLKL